MIVDVRHPAWVEVTPNGARKPRATLVAMLTPVKTRRVAASEVRHVRDLRDGPCVKEHGGLLWKRLDLWPGPGETTNRPCTPKEWTAFLSGDPCGHGEWRLGNALRMTPLVALAFHEPRRRLDASGHGIRGGDVPQGRISSDGRDVAAGEVARFLASDALITGDEVLLRYRPTLHLSYEFAGMLGGTRLRYAEGSLPSGILGSQFPFRPDRAIRDVAELGGRGWDGVEDGAIRADRAALAGFDDTDEDLRVLANWLPCALSSATRIWAGQAAVGPAGRLAVREAGAMLADLTRRGCTGSVTMEDAAASLATVETAIRHALRDMPDPDPNARDWLNVLPILSRLQERIASPAPVTGEDAEAMAGLGM